MDPSPVKAVSAVGRYCRRETIINFEANWYPHDVFFYHQGNEICTYVFKVLHILLVHSLARSKTQAAGVRGGHITLPTKLRYDAPKIKKIRVSKL